MAIEAIMQLVTQFGLSGISGIFLWLYLSERKASKMAIQNKVDRIRELTTQMVGLTRENATILSRVLESLERNSESVNRLINRIDYFLRVRVSDNPGEPEVPGLLPILDSDTTAL